MPSNSSRTTGSGTGRRSRWAWCTRPNCAATLHRHRRILTGAGLPTSYLAGAWPALRKAMAVDKKARGAALRFVVLEGPARPVILADPPEGLLEQAYAEVTSR